MGTARQQRIEHIERELLGRACSVLPRGRTRKGHWLLGRVEKLGGGADGLLLLAFHIGDENTFP